MNRQRLLPFAMVAVATLFQTSALKSVNAQTWDGGGGNNNWSTSGNWNPSGAPVNNSTAIINFAGSTRTNPNLDISYSINRIIFTNGASGFALTSSAGTILTIGAGGITNKSANLQTINIGNIVLSAAQTWNALTNDLVISSTITNGGNTLTIDGANDTTLSGAISGTGGLTMVGTGTLLLSGSNNLSGTVTAGAGTIAIGNNYALGTGGLTLNGGSLLASGAARTITNLVNATGDFGIGGSQDLTFASNFNLTGNRVMTVSNSGLTTISGSLGQTTGTPTFTKAGTGTLVLSGSNTLANAITVSAGTLNIQNSNALGTTNFGTTVSSGATLELQGGVNVDSESLLISGNGNGGNGALRNVSGSNAWSGHTVQSANATIGSAAGTLTLSGNLTNGGFNTALVGGGNIIFGGIVSGTGNLTNNSTGTVSLEGTSANTISGALIVNAGTVLLNKTAGVNAFAGALTVGDGTGGSNADVVRLSASNQIPNASAVTVNSSGLLDLNDFSDTINLATNNGGAVTTGAGTLTMAGDLVAKSSNGTSATISGNLDLGGTRSFTVNTGSSTVDLDISATVSGANTLTKQGTGRMQLSGSNAYSGLTTVSAGQLRLTDNNALGTTAGTNLVVSGAAMELAGDITITGEALGISGTGVSGTGALLNVSGTNTWVGPITLGANSTIGSTAGMLMLDSNVNNGGFTLTFTGAGDAQVDGSISGSGALIKTNTGKLILTGSNSYTGATTISNGVVNIRSTNALGTTAAGTTVLSGGELQLQGGIAVGAEALTINSDGVTTNGSLRNISGSNVYGGALTFGSASTIGVDAGVLNLSNNINNGGFHSALIGAGDIILGGAISGAGNLTNNSTGTVSINGTTANTMSGALIVNSGTVLLNKTAGVNAVAGALTVGDGTGGSNADVVRLSASNQIPNASAVTVNSSGLLDLNGFSDTINLSANNGGAVATGTGTLTMAGDLVALSSNGTPATISGNLNLGGNRTFTVNNGSSTIDLDISASISGANTLSKQGTGTMQLSGSNSYSGVTTVAAGSLRLTDGGALGSTNAGTTVTAGAALELTNNVSVGLEFLTVNGTGTGTSGALLNVGGSNTWAGNVVLGSAATIGSSAGTLTLNGNLTNATFVPTFTGAGDTIVNGVISGSGGLTKSGTGSLILAGNNTYTGASTISSGTVVARHNNALGTTAGSTAISSAGSVQIDGNGLNIPEAINTLSATGGSVGALRNLGNTNTWSGVITLADAAASYRINSDAGLLNLTGGINETGNSGGKNITFGGAGNINVTGSILDSGGDMLLTKDGAGTLTLAGTNTYDGTSTISGGGLNLIYTNANSSKLSDTAALTLSGVSLDLIGGAHTDAVGSTTIDTGATSISRSSGSSILRMNTITHNTGGTVNFGATSIAQVDNANVNGILGGWATIGGADWAVNSLNGNDGPITAYTSYTDVALGGSIANAAPSNVRIIGGTTGNIALGSTTTFINTLLQNHASNATIDLAGRSLRLGTNGGILLPSGKGSLTIGTNAGSGTLFVGGSTTNVAGELIFFNNSTNGIIVNSTIANNGSGVLTLVNSGPGTVTLNGTNTFTGQSYLNDGVLSISKNSGLGAVGTGAQINFDGGTLQATSTFALDNAGSNRRAVVLSDNGGTFNVTEGNNLTVSGVISGVGALNKTGAGTTSLTAANTYSGKTTVTDGTLVLSNATALPGGILASGGTSALTINGGVIGLGNGNFTRDLGTGADQVQFTGSGGFAAFGADRSVNLGGGTPAATVTWNSGNFLPTGASLILGATNADKTVDFQNPINLDGAVRTVRVNNGNAAIDAILSGALTGAGSSGLTKTGGGTLSLTGINTFTGATTIDDGTLVASVAGALQNTSGITVNTGGTLLLAGSGDRINNAAAVALNGGTLNTAGLSETVGVLTLSADSTIDLGAGASIVNFANSASASWTGGTTLTIQGWSGSDNGGGTDQLFFGNSTSGLTAGQLAQISFLNPAGHAPGTYAAGILGNGEVVPVPEPATWIAFLSLSGMLVFRERKRLFHQLSGTIRPTNK